MKLGAHVSAAGGLATAFDRGEEAGCDCIQIFTKNKGAWAARPLGDEEISEFRSRARRSSIGPVVTHASYLLNLASPEKELRDKSVDALRIELERCEALGIPSLVLHPGAHKETGEAAGLKRVVSGLNRAHRQTAGFKVRVLLENSAGQGSSVCSDFASLGRIIDGVKEPERLGVCIDTCHAFAAGYELRTAEGYDETKAALKKAVGLRKVRCLHLNDSKKDLGSRVDRHEHIGDGFLGREAFRHVLTDGSFRNVPMIFELPPDNGMLEKNLRILRQLAKGRASK